MGPQNRRGQIKKLKKQTIKCYKGQFPNTFKKILVCCSIVIKIQIRLGELQVAFL
jgi:hypothetical protein